MYDVASFQLKNEWNFARFDTSMKVWMIPMDAFQEEILRNFGVPVTKIDREEEEEDD